MSEGKLLAFGVSIIYFISGGRWTITLLAILLTILTPTNFISDFEDKYLLTESGSTSSDKEEDVALPNTASTSINSNIQYQEILSDGSVKLSRKPAGSLKKISFKRLDDNSNAESSTTRTTNTPLTKKRVPKIIKAKKPVKKVTSNSNSVSPTLTTNDKKLLDSNFLIFYSSLTGSSLKAANTIKTNLINANCMNEPKLLNLDNDVDDLDNYFLKTPMDNEKDSSNDLVYILVLPSYETDSPIDYFLETLEDTINDFRVDKYPLSKLTGFAVLGLGDTESWPEKFCYQSKLTDKYLSKLGGRRLFPLGQVCMKTGGLTKIEEWSNSLVESLKDNETLILANNDLDDSDEEDIDIDEDGGSSSEDGSTLVDVEDIGKVIGDSQQQRSPSSNGVGANKEIKQMVAKDSPTYKSLTKQGYTVVGSHSGVKICRWTKSALRGRGLCYKYAFYGIRSHLCMETTPSLSCSNKCVFCWRHGTNPVGTSWRWQVDKPEVILKGALEGHYKKIKQMRGVPGVNVDRFNEAFTVRHCALSLVGEPIFYPHINEFVSMLHERKISSFLVCNAQHPEQLYNMSKVTQLYVSIDAPTKDELKVVDRPLFRDYWERLNKCLDILRTKQQNQRTVFRLTLVKGFNMNEVSGYADFVEKGLPSLIEIKGATFCGSSDGNGNPLTMQNIPFYEECQNFVRSLNKELNSRGLSYDIAAEHAHSCCILIAQTKFKIDNKWYTHIDYDKFFQLLSEKGEDFNELDYISETPDWAYWGSEEAGFNPADTRFNRKDEKAKKKLAAAEELKSSSSTEPTSITTSTISTTEW
ncbi:hypothetical protein BVG19_g5114 [[Candida] boidinii]|nr:hypothetical protein BVG19_g5114 [[Candida] boidinii]OWB50388.1 hypothetical protein B5S27_g1938 [[Candida] boidinii]